MKHEQEIVTLRAEVDKLNCKWRSSQVLDDILNCQRSPLIKIGLEYVGESSCCKDENVKEEAMLHDKDGKKPHEEKPSSKDEEKPLVKEEKKPRAKNEEKPKVKVLHKSTNTRSKKTNASR